MANGGVPQPEQRLVPELRLGPIESMADVELALREIQDRLNEIIRKINAQ